MAKHTRAIISDTQTRPALMAEQARSVNATKQGYAYELLECTLTQLQHAVANPEIPPPIIAIRVVFFLSRSVFSEAAAAADTTDGPNLLLLRLTADTHLWAGGAHGSEVRRGGARRGGRGGQGEAGEAGVL